MVRQEKGSTPLSNVAKAGKKPCVNSQVSFFVLCTPLADWGRSHRSPLHHGWLSLSFPGWHLQACQYVPSQGKVRKRVCTENWSVTEHPREGADLHLYSRLISSHQCGCKEASARCKSRILPDIRFDLHQIFKGFWGSSHLYKGLCAWPWTV